MHYSIESYDPAILARADEESNKRLHLLREHHRQNYLKDLYEANLPRIAKATKQSKKMMIPSTSSSKKQNRFDSSKHSAAVYEDKENSVSYKSAVSSLKQHYIRTPHGANKENMPYLQEQRELKKQSMQHALMEQR